MNNPNTDILIKSSVHSLPLFGKDFNIETYSGDLVGFRLGRGSAGVHFSPDIDGNFARLVMKVARRYGSRRRYRDRRFPMAVSRYHFLATLESGLGIEVVECGQSLFLELTFGKSTYSIYASHAYGYSLLSGFIDQLRREFPDCAYGQNTI